MSLSGGTDWRGLGGVAPPTPAALTSRQQLAVRARYDNAETTDENKRNWWATDYLSAKAANSFAVRRTLRMRSRYEVSNNPYLFGITNNNADDLVGTGPTLQVTTPDTGYNREVERAFNEWATEVELVEKLRTCKLAKTVDGEGFLVLRTVEDLESPVKLYPCDIEADQVTTPAPQSIEQLWVDGLILHPVTGRPKSFTILKQHPGDYFFPTLNPQDVATVPARHVIHWFNKFRPGQVRGIPTFTSSLDLFAEYRSYRRAVVGAAELAADFAAVATSDAPADPGSEDTDVECQPFDRVQITRKMMTVLPAGMQMQQFDPKQPTGSHEGFLEACLGEAVRPLSYPVNLALGTSQKFNFSSSKLDMINYRESLTVERVACERTALTPRIFRQWFEEAVLGGHIRPYDGLNLPPHEWHWPGYASIDPQTDADADHSRLSNGTLTWQRFWASRGCDWRDMIAQQKAEKEAIEKAGLSFGEPPTKTITEDGDTGSPDGAPPKKKGKPQPKPDATEAAIAAAANRSIRAFDEGKIKRDDDGKFGDKGGSTHHTGSSGDSHADLKDKARGLWGKVKGLGGKVVAAAKEVGFQAKALAFNATWATMKAGVHADSVLDTAHDYSKIVNDKAMNAQIAEHIGIPLGSAVQNAITKVAAYGICKIKGWIAKRREGKAASADTKAKPLSDKDKAKHAAEVLGMIFTSLGVSKDKLPKPASIAAWLKKKTNKADAAAGVAHA